MKSIFFFISENIFMSANSEWKFTRQFSARTIVLVLLDQQVLF